MGLGLQGRVAIVAAASQGLGRGGVASYINGASVAIDGGAVRSLL